MNKNGKYPIRLVLNGQAAKEIEASFAFSILLVPSTRSLTSCAFFSSFSGTVSTTSAEAS